MITLTWLYTLAGAMFAAFALLSLSDKSNAKRLGNAAFWGSMALSLLGGDFIGDFGNGLLVLGLAGLAGFGFIGRSSPPTTSSPTSRPTSPPTRQPSRTTRAARSCRETRRRASPRSSCPPTRPPSWS